MTNNASEATIDQAIPATNGKVATPILEASAVTMAFGGVRALSEVSVSFAAGEICGLIGPNGAGKTTLFDCLTGIRRPTSGSIRYGGEEVTCRSATWFARQGMRRTFQRQQIFGWLPVEDNVLVALEWRGGGGGLAADLLSLPSRRSRERERRARVDEVLERCGLEALRLEPAANLPIGQARMVELARAVEARGASAGFTRLVAPALVAQRLRNDLWVSAELAREAAAVLEGRTDASVQLRALLRFLDYFQDGSYQLLRYGDLEAVDRFLSIAGEAAQSLDGPLARSRLGEDCALFGDSAEALFLRIGRRSEITGRRFDRAHAEAVLDRFRAG